MICDEGDWTGAIKEYIGDKSLQRRGIGKYKIEERKGGKARPRRLIESTQEAMRASDSSERPRARELAGNSFGGA